MYGGPSISMLKEANDLEMNVSYNEYVISRSDILQLWPTLKRNSRKCIKQQFWGGKNRNDYMIII